MGDKPQVGLLDATIEWRVNSTAMKINEAFERSRVEARDEALWLASVCRSLWADNDSLRVEIEGLKKALEFAQTKRGNQ